MSCRTVGEPALFAASIQISAAPKSNKIYSGDFQGSDSRNTVE